MKVIYPRREKGLHLMKDHLEKISNKTTTCAVQTGKSRQNAKIGLIGIGIVLAVSAFTVAWKYNADTWETAGEEKVRQVHESVWTDYDAAECVRLGDYTEVKIRVSAPSSVTDEDFGSYIDNICADNPMYTEIRKDEIESGDYVNIDFTGNIDGADGSSTAMRDFTLQVGSEYMVPGFEDALIGHKAGDDIAFMTNYPSEGAAEEYRGKTAIFKITVNYIADADTYDSSRLTDDYVKHVFNAHNTDEFLARIKAEMYDIISDCEKQAANDECIESYMDTCKVEIPDGLVKQRCNQMRVILLAGSKENPYEATTGETEQTAEELGTVDKEEMEKAVAFDLVAEVIAEKEGIAEDDAAWNSYLQTQMDFYGMDEEAELFEKFDTPYESGKDYLHRQYIDESVQGLLLSNVSYMHDEDATVSGIAANRKQTEQAAQ